MPAPCAGALAGLGGAVTLVGDRAVGPSQFDFSNSLYFLAIAHLRHSQHLAEGARDVDCHLVRDDVADLMSQQARELILIGQEQLGDIPEDVLVSRLQERIAKRRERRA